MAPPPVTQQISTCFQQIYTLPTQYTLTVSDQAGVNRSVLVGNVSSSTYFRAFLAPADGSFGSNILAPHSYMAYLQARLNAAFGGLWTLSVQNSGLVKITYNGTGTGAITWDVGQNTSTILGFVSNVGPLATGASQNADYYPTHNIYLVGRRRDTGWSRMPPKYAIGEMADGTTFALSNKKVRLQRKFDSITHARTETLRSNNGLGASPIQPNVFTRQLAPTSAAGTPPPWSLLDFFGTILDNRLAALFSNFQSYTQGFVSFSEIVSATGECLKSTMPIQPTRENYSVIYDWRNMSFWKIAEENF